MAKKVAGKVKKLAGKAKKLAKKVGNKVIDTYPKSVWRLPAMMPDTRAGEGHGEPSQEQGATLTSHTPCSQ